MATRGFGAITPDAGHPQPIAGTTATDPAAGARPRMPTRRISWAWVIAVTLAVVTVLVIAVVAGGHRDRPGGAAGFAVRAAHGPTRVLGNVPVGYSRDRSGAATAAVNVVQALAQAGSGRIAMDKVVAALVATDPGPALRASIALGSNRAPDSDVLTVLPAAVSVTAFTDTTAEVSVWTMGVSRASISPGDPVSVTTVWSTDTVELVWQDGDWRAREKTGRVGPTPDDAVAPTAGSPLAQPLVGGYYTIYVD
ncbi:hypothetical protein [Nocardia sp. alder85J]|uniref:hypothetical protein n=1 Tax=Nocardia sp. alder85J TaxID=2862949 RepID=UPI001CD2CA77|nr:hypothetical protein [Nocardia sp. alder85J]MCX4097698.1 hypothetical protein [Nocardia sp. alder85J]